MASRSKVWDVVVVGDFFIDIVMSGFHEFPRLGEEAFARTLCHEIGGGAAITSCGLARLGLNVAALGVVGKDDGFWIVKKLIAAGVNASALENHPTESSGVTVSVSTSEDRAFFTYYGANDRLGNLLRDPDARALMSRARHVHFACGPDPVSDADLFSELHAAGCNVSIDVGWHEFWLTDSRKDNMLKQADLFFPNEREAALMTGHSEPEAIIQALTGQGVRNFALKLGPKGAVLSWRGELIWCPPYPVDPVDTTGAGDCFDAGFIYGWLNGESPEYCMRAANVCGALSTRGLGGVRGFPSKEELEEALEPVRS
ncbi:MAG: carbohydrate kinase family protein [Bryobacteraceae bacterium]